MSFCLQYVFCTFCKAFVQYWDNTKTLIGGPFFQMKNVSYRRADRLHRRQKGGPAYCTKGRASRLKKLEKGSPLAHPFPQPSLMCSPLARPVVQHRLPARPSIKLASPWKIHVFHLVTRPSSPPFSVIRSIVLLPFSTILTNLILFIFHF